MAYAKSRDASEMKKFMHEKDAQIARVQKYLSITENVLFNMVSATPCQEIDPEVMVKKAFAIADAYVATIYGRKEDETTMSE